MSSWSFWSLKIVIYYSSVDKVLIFAGSNTGHHEISNFNHSNVYYSLPNDITVHQEYIIETKANDVALLRVRRRFDPPSTVKLNIFKINISSLDFC